MQVEFIAAIPSAVAILHNALSFLYGELKWTALLRNYFDEFRDAGALITARLKRQNMPRRRTK